MTVCNSNFRKGRESQTLLPPFSSGTDSATVHTLTSSLYVTPDHSFSLRCLRDALDCTVFFNHGFFNYKAVLDTMLDVAKALFHLHQVSMRVRFKNWKDKN